MMLSSSLEHSESSPRLKLKQPEKTEGKPTTMHKVTKHGHDGTGFVANSTTYIRAAYL